MYVVITRTARAAYEQEFRTLGMAMHVAQKEIGKTKILPDTHFDEYATRQEAVRVLDTATGEYFDNLGNLEVDNG